MHQLIRRYLRWTLLAVILTASAVAPASLSQAATTTTSITAVNVVRAESINGNTSATITFSYTSSVGNLRYQVNYGTTASYSSSLPVQALPNPTGSTTFILSGLAEGTTYHFNIQIFDAGNTEVARSADRTFTTPRTAGNQQLSISNIRMDCVDVSCIVSFSTNVNATVEAKWSAAGSFDFDQVGLANTHETAAGTGTRTLQLAGLTANTTYHYRLRAVGPSGQITTGDLTFVTSASSTDHIFATGICSSGGITADIGSCIGSQLCYTAGVLVSDCTKCGFTCGQGTTCRAGSPALCVADEALATPAVATQCNSSTCYGSNGRLLNPAPAGCYSSWPQCTANTILKVTRDRGCNLWLSCASSIQTNVAGSGNQNLCLSLGACNSLGANGQCNHYLPPGQCSNDPLRFCNEDEDCQAGGTCNNPDASRPTKALQDVTYQTPAKVNQIANLSGNILTGLDWSQQGGANVIQGGLPWQLMRQIGGDAQIKNGDLEYNAPSLPEGWVTVPTGVDQADALKVQFEDVNAGPNHVLNVDPITQARVASYCSNNSALSCTQDTDCATAATGGTCTAIPLLGISRCSNNITRACTSSADCTTTTATTAVCTAFTEPVDFPGVATNEFTASPSEYYYAEARIRANGATPRVRMQFGYDGYTKFVIPATNTPTFVDVSTTAAWQRVTLGPLVGLSGSTRLAFVCADSADCSSFQVDDVIVKPILQVNTNPSYITPSCRLYPKDDAPACDYTDTNGIIYKGWKGYCLEHDSQTGTCLSWWPVDILKGESNVFGTETAAGYQNRSPLYLCAQAVDTSVGDDFGYNQPYVVAERGIAQSTSACNPAGNGCDLHAVYQGFDTIGQCSDFPNSGACTFSPVTDKEPDGKTATLHEEDIVKAEWIPSLGETVQSRGFTFINSSEFHTSSAASPTYTEQFDEGRLERKIYREVRADGIYWILATDFLTAVHENLNFNKVDAYLKFDLTTHQLIQYGLSLTDATGDTDNSGISYRVKFTVRPACSKIVQVVGNSGENASFANRIQSSSYAVPDLGYKLSKDLNPYGAVLQPENSANPTDWPLLPIIVPDTKNYTAPGQSRGGSPYACNGPCTDVICTTNPNNHCDSSTAISTCQTADSTGLIGECIGINAAGANRGAQSFSSAVASATSTAFDDQYYAQLHIMRLFTATYGAWQWSPSTQHYVAIGGSWNPPSTLCPANPAAQGPVCSSATQQCTQSIQVNGTHATADATVNSNCASNPDCSAAVKAAMAKCGLQTTNNGTADLALNGLTVTNAEPIYVGGDPNNPQVVACNGVSSQCPGQTGVNGYSAGTLVPYTSFALSSPCSVANGQYSCTGRCSSTRTYVKAGQTTAATAAPFLRPTYQSGSNADYCGIPPTISNSAFVNGTSATATITGGSGAITIKFNTNADSEQLPLKNINIDWGDSQDTFAFPYAPRNDVNKPHIFTHTYVLNKGDTAHCKPFGSRTACTFPIKIQVVDNWGWCNDKQTGTDYNCHPGTAARVDTSQWYDTGLKVIVQP